MIDTIHAVLRSLMPFEWAEHRFMIHALLAVAFLAPCCAALGVHVVNFRMAFFSDAISHSAFTGVVIGYLLVPVFEATWPGAAAWNRILPPATVVLFGVAVGAGITAVRRKTDLASDTVIGVFFATVIAMGIAVISHLHLRADFERYLYGSLIGAAPSDVAVAIIAAFVVLLFLALNFNPLLLIGLNESLARSRDIRTRAMDHAFSLLVALVVTVSLPSVGLLLVTAMLVVPAAAARNIARSAGCMLVWAVLIGWASGVGGLIGSFYADTAAGAAIILVAAAIFVLSLSVGRLPRASARG